MYTAVSGQSAVFKQLEVISNNLANVDTSGYKAERMLFEKSLKEEQNLQTSFQSDIKEPSHLNPNEFVEVRGTYTDMEQGPVQQTGNPLDAAIDGPGFFVVQTENGERLTRNGSFQLNENSELVNQSGHPVLGAGGQIQVPNGSEVQIQPDGGITANGQSVGNLRVVDVGTSTLSRERGQLFKVPEGEQAMDFAEVSVTPGAIEGSNVNAVRELTDMIYTSRLFDALQKGQESSGEMNRNRNQTLGTTS